MKRIVVLNNKSDLTAKSAKKYPVEINDYIRSDQTVIICPSSVYIPYFQGKYSFKLGSQNISDKSITGELTGEVLKSLEIEYVLIETNDRKNEYQIESKQINNKIETALKNGIRPIITIGETFYEKQLNKTADVIAKQLKEYFKNIEVEQDIIINYSPNYSYQGKQVPTVSYIQEVVDFIKDYIKRKYNVNIKVLYGGNITIDNIESLDKINNINGYLITNSSTNLKEIITILNKMK